MTTNIPVKLPVIETFLQVLLTIKNRYLLFLKYSVPLFLVFLLMIVFGIFLEGPNKEQQSGFMLYTVMIILMLTLSVTIVSFDRIFIMDITDIVKTKVFRLSSRDWKFIGWYFAISIFAGLIYVPIQFIIMPLVIENSESKEYMMLFFVIVSIPVYYLVSRWLLVLPAASVDDEEASISYAWQLSKGNGLRLLLLITIIPILLNLLVFILPVSNSIMLNILSSVYFVISSVVGIGVISLSYSYLKLNVGRSEDKI